MKHRLLIFVTSLCVWLAPSLTLAADEEALPNARVSGHTVPVALKEGSSMMLYPLLILLALFCVAVMFKNSKRSHLD